MVDNPIPSWPGELVDLGEQIVHVRSTPRGPAETAVYVHGLAGSATNWTDLMDELSDVATGHAVDLPGAGYSPEPPGRDYSVAAHARTVVAMIERVADRPVHLFGNSLGGAVSVRVAATRPDLVRSLTLISPALPDLLPRSGPARVALSTVPRLGEWAAGRMRALPAGAQAQRHDRHVLRRLRPDPPGAAQGGGRGAAPQGRPAVRRRRADQLGAGPRRGVLQAR